MKKNAFVACFISFGMVLSVAFSPSVDGRAVVAGKDELPEGLFAKTVGYLPGDSVSVTNPANGNTVDVLVVGSLDTSEGVAILLSDMAAERLKIQKDANNLVRLTRRTGKLDESVYGIAVISSEGAPAKSVSSETISENETLDVNVSSDSIQNNENLDDERTSTDEISPVIEEIAVKKDIHDDIDQGGDLIEEVAELKPHADTTMIEETAELSAIKQNSNADKTLIEEPVKAVDKLPPAEAEMAEQPVEEVAVKESARAEKPAVEDARQEELIKDGVLVAKPASDKSEKEELVEDGMLSVKPADSKEAEPVTVSESIPARSDDVAKKIPEVSPATDSPSADNIAKESAPKEKTEADNNESKATETETFEYTPIVLVPSEPKTPTKTDKNDSADKDNDIADSGNKESVDKVAEASKNTERSYVLPSDLAGYEQNSLRDLKSNSYYVQIAVLSKVDNIRNNINKYGDNYPMVLVPLSRGNAYQVLVGPLGKDEYGTVLERFKDRGFKDAFLRKIK